MAAPDRRELLVLADRVHTFADAGSAATDGGARDRVDALLLRDGRVAAVGSGRELETRVGPVERLDLRGATITPGLTDAHIHLLDWALARREVDLSGVGSPEEAARFVARFAGGATTDRPERSAGDVWVRGRGWNPHLWGGLPDRGILDRVIADRPVALQSHDMHALWLNTRGLERAGISAATPDPEGGRIVRDAEGAPTGVLLENAVPLAERAMAAPSDRELVAAALDAQRELHGLGITGIHSFPGVHAASLDPLRILEALRASGRLRLRVLQHIPLPLLDEAVRLGLRSGFGGDWIRIGGVKIFLDGALGSRTAWLREPYEGTDDSGIQVLPEAEFRDAVRRAAAAGLATTVHAIGDAAVGLALDVLADPATRGAALPHRIEHVQLCPLERFGDAGRAGIVCSMQPAHLITDWRAADRVWGRRRNRGAYAFRSLAATATGAVLAFGSDAPVEPVDPRLGLYAATRRQDLAGEPGAGWVPEERIEIETALRGYTRGPAHAAGADRMGHLAPGAVADFVAWDRDPLETEGPELLSLRCVATVVDGAVVWRDRS